MSGRKGDRVDLCEQQRRGRTTPLSLLVKCIPKDSCGGQHAGTGKFALRG